MKKGILVTSFGTSYKDARERGIYSLVDEVKSRFEDYYVDQAFTSRMVINILKKRDNYHRNNPYQGLVEMAEKGIEEIYVLPLLILEGHEYEKTLRDIEKFKEEYKNVEVKIARSLLAMGQENYLDVIQALNLEKLGDREATIYMGHGSDHEADLVYKKIEDQIKEEGYRNIFIATIEGSRGLDSIEPILKERAIEKISLRPFMLVAGDHAKNDMAGDDEDSWKTILEGQGYELEPVLEGLGELAPIREVFISRLKDIL